MTVSSPQWLYGFEEVERAEAAAGGDWDAVRGLLGGKGANLGDMTRLGIPVPPGFTITTDACLAYLEGGKELPAGLWDEVSAALTNLEATTGRAFGDPDKPLLLSCRSGAKFSMPGMMDTVLDIGLNDNVVKGLIEETGDAKFVFDSYRRLIQMFATVVIGMREHFFDDALEQHRRHRGVESDADLTSEDLEHLAHEYQEIVARRTGSAFPTQPAEQLRMAVEAVFRSWNGRRAVDYREAAGIPHDLGTAVTVQSMVFGNTGPRSATGVAMSRSTTTGDPELEGDFLINAQGEDVVAGIRATKPISDLAADMALIHDELQQHARALERHYRDVQDIEFTIEDGRLWILQTRDAKRTAQAAVRIAVDLAEEGLISKTEAVERVSADQVEFFLHPQLDTAARSAAIGRGDLIASGLNVAPGAAVGVVVLDPDLAVTWAEEGRAVVLVRPETKPDDVHGMLAAEGIVTTRGGRTSHAALVARQFGKPAVVGVAALEIDMLQRVIRVGSRTVREGEWLSIDGTAGEVFAGRLETMAPNIDDAWLEKLLGWADRMRSLGVWANADTGDDAVLSRRYGAEGIGLARTEHMFLSEDRLPIVRRMITAVSPTEETAALEELLPLQRADFIDLFCAMDGLGVTIRLIDPPLHEFLPRYDDLVRQLADFKVRLREAGTLDEIDGLLEGLDEVRNLLERVEPLQESNPMLGLRGVRLGLLRPALPRMQVRAIFEAACHVAQDGVSVIPKIMVPLTSDAEELARMRRLLESEARDVMREHGVEIPYQFGTMIEVPRAALTAGAIARHAEFVSFGTNDLTQMTYAMSRDDAETAFLTEYLESGVLADNPFASLDPDGVGALMRIAVAAGREQRPDLEVGICGEHGGDPQSIAFCHALGIDYVSCSPPRVPVARLAAAHAALQAAG